MKEMFVLKKFGINVKKATLNVNPSYNALYNEYLADLESAELLQSEEIYQAIQAEQVPEDNQTDNIFFKDYLWKRDGGEAAA